MGQVLECLDRGQMERKMCSGGKVELQNAFERAICRGEADVE